MLLSILARIVVGVLLIVHGFAHYNLPTLWGSRSSLSSWLLGGMGQAALRTISSMLWVVTLLVFLVAGIVTFTNQPAWRALTIGGAVVSLLTMFLFWDAKMILGVVVDVAVLVALIGLKWPAVNILR